MTKQIKSKERVADHGEVFTNEREVKAMCDLVNDECERIDSRFLEPACGDGNFLAEILNRKLNIVESRYKKNKSDYEKFSFLACTSIYGVELLSDNAQICRDRMVSIWTERYIKLFKKVDADMQKVIKYVFSKNIVCGNALTLMCVDDKQQDTKEPIIFIEWSFVKGILVKRREFRLDVLLKEGLDDKKKNKQESLFDNPEDNYSIYLEKDTKNDIYIPKPMKEYPPTNFRKLTED